MRRRKPTGPFFRTKEGASFENFRFSPQNTVLLSEPQAKHLERKMRIQGLLSENPEKVFSDPVLIAELHRRLPEKERLSLLRAQLRVTLLAGLSNPARLRREERFFPSPKRRGALLAKLDALPEEQLVKLLLKSKKLKGKRFEDFMLKMTLTKIAQMDLPF